MQRDPRFTIDGNLGKFIDLDGNRVADPGQAAVVIVAGLWGDMPKGAMQQQCRICKRLVGLAPPSQKMLAQPGRVCAIFCRDCWEGLQHYRAEGVKGLEDWLKVMDGKLY